MDQLIQQITQRTGIEETQARDAVEMVVSYLKTHLPAPIAAQVDTALSGQGSQDLVDQGQQMLGNLGGMFGKR
jgi:nucleoid DNA-binding protein